MTNTSADPTVAGTRLGLLALGPTLVLGAVSLAAWAGTITWALETGNGPGTMGLGLAAFIGMWALMMTAMMLPVTIPLVARSDTGPTGSPFWSGSMNWTALGQFTAGYVLLWAATGLIAYPAAVGAGQLAAHDPGAARVAAVVLFLVAGLYQLSEAKGRCLERCRRTVAEQVALDRSPWQRGGRHGIWCLGCSWALMALLIAVGVMNIPAMIIISAGLFSERQLVPGRPFRMVSGVVVIALGVVVAFDPALASGLHAMPNVMPHM